MNPSSRSQLAPAVDLRDATILLVDDDVESANKLAELLKEAGFQPQLAHTGPQAKQAVFRNPPDGVILDLKRADMDSFELCRQLKMTPQTRIRTTRPDRVRTRQLRIVWVPSLRIASDAYAWTEAPAAPAVPSRTGFWIVETCPARSFALTAAVSSAPSARSVCWSFRTNALMNWRAIGSSGALELTVTRPLSIRTTSMDGARADQIGRLFRRIGLPKRH